jgi:hypothetical protein
MLFLLLLIYKILIVLIIEGRYSKIKGVGNEILYF